MLKDSLSSSQKKEPFAAGFAIRASHFDGVAVNAITAACAGVAAHNFRTGVEGHGVADGGNGAAGHGVAAVGEGAIRRKVDGGIERDVGVVRGVADVVSITAVEGFACFAGQYAPALQFLPCAVFPDLVAIVRFAP